MEPQNRISVPLEQSEYARQIDALQRQVDAMTAKLAECYRLSGADPNNDDDCRLASYAVGEVKRLRDEYDQQSNRLLDLAAKLEASELARECAYRQGTEDAHQCQQRHAHIDGLEKQVKDLQAQLSTAHQRMPLPFGNIKIQDYITTSFIERYEGE